jgi:hypothetical protein
MAEEEINKADAVSGLKDADDISDLSGSCSFTWMGNRSSRQLRTAGGRRPRVIDDRCARRA